MMIKQVELENGLTLTFFDRSNRYFGDYNRVLVEAEISCRVDQALAADDPLRLRALTVFGETVMIKRPMERMGVASADVEATRNQMVDDFLASAADYLARDDYPAKLVRTELANQRKVRRLYPESR